MPSVVRVPAHRAEVLHAFEISVNPRILHASYFDQAAWERFFRLQNDCVQQCGVAGVLPRVAADDQDIALSGHFLVRHSLR